MIFIRDTSEGAIFTVRIHPRARRNAITGMLGEGDAAAIKVALCAPPIDGRANEALTEYFADLFDVPRFAISILSGAQSRNKVLRISGRTANDLAPIFHAALNPQLSPNSPHLGDASGRR